MDLGIPLGPRVGMGICRYLVDLYVIACWLCYTCKNDINQSIQYCKCIINDGTHILPVYGFDSIRILFRAGEIPEYTAPQEIHPKGP